MAIASERGKLILRKTERDLLRLAKERQADGLNPEAVHGFRTTTRRLQTLLEQVIPDGGRDQKKLLKMLNRIRKSAGRLRDVDVQLAALRSLKVQQEPRRKTQLTQGLVELRSADAKRLGKLLRKSEIHELRKRLKRAARSVNFESSRDPLAAARQILGSVTLPKGPADEETLHRYRIVVKRARYAAEFAPSSAESKQFITQLKRLQDALGNWHDWMTLTRTAVDRLGDVHESSLVAALHNVTRGKYRQAIAAVSATQAGPTDSKTAERTRKVAAKNPAGQNAAA